MPSCIEGLVPDANSVHRWESEGLDWEGFKIWIDWKERTVESGGWMEGRTPLWLYLTLATSRHCSFLFCGCCEVNSFPPPYLLSWWKAGKPHRPPSSTWTKINIFSELFFSGNYQRQRANISDTWVWTHIHTHFLPPPSPLSPPLHLFLFPGICMPLAYLGLIRAWLAETSAVYPSSFQKRLSHVIQWENSRDVERRRDCGTKDFDWVEWMARFPFLYNKTKTNLKSKGILCSGISIGGVLERKPI